MDMVKVEALAKWIRESKNIVAFTGAGCSTESGVPDFRSPGGVFDLGGLTALLLQKTGN